MVKVTKNVYNKYSREDLQKAIQAVKDGKHCSSAAKVFGVPWKTIADHISVRLSLNRRAGRERNIPEEIDNAIVNKVIKAYKAGFPLTKNQFPLKVAGVVKRLGLKTKFKNEIPRKNYWSELKKETP